jgi:ribosomal protein L4
MCKFTCAVRFVVNRNKKVDKTPFTKLGKKVLEKLGNDKENWLNNTLFKACKRLFFRSLPPPANWRSMLIEAKI